MQPLQNPGEDGSKFKNPFQQWTDIGSAIKKCLKNAKVSEMKVVRGTSTMPNGWDEYSTGTIFRPEQAVGEPETFSQLICSSNSTPDYSIGIKFDLNAGNLLHLLVTSPCIFLAFLAGCGVVMFLLNRSGAGKKTENENVEDGEEAGEENSETENGEQIQIPIKEQETCLAGNGMADDGNQNKAPFQAAVKRMIAIFLYQLQRHGSNESSKGMGDEGSTRTVSGIGNENLGGTGDILNTIPEEVNIECQKYADMKENLYKDKIIWPEMEEVPGNSEV